jgi:hypothetical protein
MRAVSDAPKAIKMATVYAVANIGAPGINWSCLNVFQAIGITNTR